MAITGPVMVPWGEDRVALHGCLTGPVIAESADYRGTVHWDVMHPIMITGSVWSDWVVTDGCITGSVIM